MFVQSLQVMMLGSQCTQVEFQSIVHQAKRNIQQTSKSVYAQTIKLIHECKTLTFCPTLTIVYSIDELLH